MRRLAQVLDLGLDAVELVVRALGTDLRSLLTQRVACTLEDIITSARPRFGLHSSSHGQISDLTRSITHRST